MQNNIKDGDVISHIYKTNKSKADTIDRDTQKFAIKCSSITTKTYKNTAEAILASVQGGVDYILKQVNVFKDPITDPGKASKKGELTLIKNPYGAFMTIDRKDLSNHLTLGATEMLNEVFRNGELTHETNLASIREQIANN